VAEEAAEAKRPNRALALVLLSLNVLATGALLISAFWFLFNDDLGHGLKHVSYGVIAFLVLSWMTRVVARPRPT
jgi:hypothetical protein